MPASSAVDRHPHLAEALPPGRVRADMHTHTMWSGDSTTTPEEFCAALAATGLDVVFVTDHQAIDGAAVIAASAPCRVVVGEELRTAAGELIGLFLHDRLPAGLGHVEAARRIRDQGGVVYVPHPFDPMRRNLAEPALRELAELGLLDAIEVLNAKTSLSSLNRRAAEFADEYGVAHGAGSDAHVPDALGAAYVEIDDFADAGEFLTALRSARVRGHHWDSARPWSPRIVPSTRTT